MKLSSFLVSVFSSIALAFPSAAPFKNSTAGIDTGALNDLVFAQLDLTYLQAINTLDLVLFQTLGIQNSLDVLVFQSLFTATSLDVQTLLQFQQLSTLLSIASTGVLAGVDLSALPLGGLQLNLVDSIGVVDLTQFIDVALEPQITIIAQQVTTVVIQG